jgi:hypothetical protein
MKLAKAMLLSVSVFCGALVLSNNVQAQTIISFDAPGAGSTADSFQGTGCFGCTFGINVWGTVVGTTLDANNVNHGFLRSPSGKFTTLDVPEADTTPNTFRGTVAQNINDWGETTGYYTDAAGVQHGFVRSPEGRYTSFDVPGNAGGPTPLNINDEGVVGGYAADANFLIHAFIREPNNAYSVFDGPGVCTDGGYPNGCYGTGVGPVSLFGVALGHFTDSNLTQHDFIREPSGKIILVDVPGAGSGPYLGTGCPGCNLGTNLFGAIAGTYSDSNSVVHAYIRSPEGTYTKYDAPGAGNTPGSYQGTGCFSDCATSLNDFGVITASYIDSNGQQHGFVRAANGKIETVDPEGSLLTQPESINDAGVVVGYWIDANLVYHGFLRLP